MLRSVISASARLCWLWLPVLAAGCHVQPPPSRFPSADDALKRMKATYSCAYGIQAEGNLQHHGNQGRFHGHLMLMASNPNRLRFQIVSFGVTAATLTVSQNQFSLYDMRNRVFFEGPPSACNVARMTQVAIPPHALVELLRGQAPLLVHSPGSSTIRWDGGGYYVVRIPSRHEAVEEIHLTPRPSDWDLPWQRQRVRVLSVEVTQRDYVHFHADLLDYAPAHTMPPREDELGIDPPIPPSGPRCEAEVPRRLHLVVPYAGNDLRLRMEEVGLNPPLPEGVFTQPVPGVVRRQHVSCSGQ